MIRLISELINKNYGLIYQLTINNSGSADSPAKIVGKIPGTDDVKDSGEASCTFDYYSADEKTGTELTKIFKEAFGKSATQKFKLDINKKIYIIKYITPDIQTFNKLYANSDRERAFVTTNTSRVMDKGIITFYVDADSFENASDIVNKYSENTKSIGDYLSVDKQLELQNQVNSQLTNIGIALGQRKSMLSQITLWKQSLSDASLSDEKQSEIRGKIQFRENALETNTQRINDAVHALINDVDSYSKQYGKDMYKVLIGENISGEKILETLGNFDSRDIQAVYADYYKLFGINIAELDIPLNYGDDDDDDEPEINLTEESDNKKLEDAYKEESKKEKSASEVSQITKLASASPWYIKQINNIDVICSTVVNDDEVEEVISKKASLNKLNKRYTVIAHLTSGGLRLDIPADTEVISQTDKFVELDAPEEALPALEEQLPEPIVIEKTVSPDTSFILIFNNGSDKIATATNIKTLIRYADSKNQEYAIIGSTTRTVYKTAETAYKNTQTGEIVSDEKAGVDKNSPEKPKKVVNNQGQELEKQEVSPA